MHQQIRRAASHPSAIALTGVLAVLGLSACGGSSGSTTTARTNSAASLAGARAGTSSTANGSTTKGNSGHAASAAPGIASLRACLRREGVKLPQNGARRGLFLGGANLPPAARAHLQAAMRKCLGSRAHVFPATGAGGAARRFASPKFRQALTAFASCLRQNGVDLPAPDTSGHGPVFRTKGLNTSSQKFREATKKCRGVLTAAFKSRP